MGEKEETNPRSPRVLLEFLLFRKRRLSSVEFEFVVEKVLLEEEDWKSSRRKEDGGTDGGRRGATANKSGPENCPSGKTRAEKLTVGAV